jgi:hypothetical protein
MAQMIAMQQFTTLPTAPDSVSMPLGRSWVRAVPHADRSSGGPGRTNDRPVGTVCARPVYGIRSGASVAMNIVNDMPQRPPSGRVCIGNLHAKGLLKIYHLAVGVQPSSPGESHAPLDSQPALFSLLIYRPASSNAPIRHGMTVIPRFPPPPGLATLFTASRDPRSALTVI